MEHPNSAPVLITGGARRIGLALAKAFLERGVPSSSPIAANIRRWPS